MRTPERTSTNPKSSWSSCDCDACREDRHRRELGPLWDFLRCYLKIQGVHYDSWDRHDFEAPTPGDERK